MFLCLPHHFLSDFFTDSDCFKFQTSFSVWKNSMVEKLRGFSCFSRKILRSGWGNWNSNDWIVFRVVVGMSPSNAAICIYFLVKVQSNIYQYRCFKAKRYWRKSESTCTWHTIVFRMLYWTSFCWIFTRITGNGILTTTYGESQTQTGRVNWLHSDNVRTIILTSQFSFICGVLSLNTLRLGKETEEIRGNREKGESEVSQGQV